MKRCNGNTCPNKDKCGVRGICSDIVRYAWKLKPLADVQLCEVYYRAKAIEVSESCKPPYLK